MSFYHGDSRPDETLPSAAHALSPVEIGVIIGTVTAFFALITTIFLYRNRKAQRLQDRQTQDTELGEFSADHKDNPHSCDGDPPEPASPTEPKPAKMAGFRSVSQLFHKPHSFRKAQGMLICFACSSLQSDRCHSWIQFASKGTQCRHLARQLIPRATTAIGGEHQEH